MNFGYRFLRLAAVALWLYGLVGAVVAAAMLVVGFSVLEQVTSLQKTFETQRAAVVLSVRGMSGTLRDTAAATSDFQRSIASARGSADQASKLANDSAGTFRNMGATLTDLTIFGIQPLAGLQPEFDSNADQLQQLAISLGLTREALAQNGSDVGRVGGDLSHLQAQLDALATSLGQPGLLGFDTHGLLALQIAFFGMCVLTLLQSAFSIVAGVGVYRLQRIVAAQPLVLKRRPAPDRLSLVP
ncbi:MAG TPA: hypothetical protein VKV73_01480 [Chloroflexota bacterium]|nr:hypothetical protein [Chloroflexota bacterium]